MAFRMALWKSDGQEDGPRNNSTIFPVCVAGFVYDDEPEDIADYVYERAQNRPDKCVVILMRNPGQQYKDFPDINDAGALAWFAGGALTDQHYSICLRFWRRWKENCEAQGNISIDAIICDFEPLDGSGSYTFPSNTFPTKEENAEFLAGLSATPEVKRLLPRSLRDVSESRWLAAMQSPAATEVRLLGEWNAHDRKIMTASQRAMVTRSYLEVMGGPAPIIHNYDDAHTETAAVDHYGWPVAASFDSMEGVSAPALYVNADVANTNGTIYYSAGTNAGRCSRFLVHLINRNNSIIGPKSIWLTNSRFDGSGPSATPATNFQKYDAWRELFMHYAASGGDALVIGYGPSIKTAELDEMELVLANAKSGQLGFDPRRHKPFDLNAATITTNGYTTTLSSLNFTRVSY